MKAEMGDREGQKGRERPVRNSQEQGERTGVTDSPFICYPHPVMAGLGLGLGDDDDVSLGPWAVDTLPRHQLIHVNNTADSPFWICDNTSKLSQFWFFHYFDLCV